MAESFEQFAARVAAPLGRAAFILVKDRYMAEDLVQETLVAVYRKWDTIRDERARYSYAYRTISRMSRRYEMRRAARRENLRAIDTNDGVADSSFDWAERSLVIDLLRSLPRRQREVIVSRYIFDRSAEQTAADLRCTIGTVKSQTFKGLQKLRTELEGAPHDA